MPDRLILSMIKTLTKFVSLFAICSVLYVMFFCFPLLSEATVTGDCSNCHTMHNSQGGQPMNFNEGSTPNKVLLRGDCIGCHGQNPSGTQNIILLGNIPQVLLSASATPLAGGNFKYLETDDNRGHNVIDIGNSEDNTNMFPPPGDQHSSGILQANFTCSGKYGCHGDRTIEDKLSSIKGAHHTVDSVLKFGSINEVNQGGGVGLSYRFLKGVKGGEDSDWQATTGPTNHNEYKGATSMGSSSLTNPANNTISGLCAECHGYFHGTESSNIGGASPWLRHPTDIILPGNSAKEYRLYNGGTGTNNPYSLFAPVARLNIPNEANGFINPGTDDAIVMCLSCHGAHASPYFKMVRWDYKGWPATGADGCDPETGKHGCCNVCHTSKN
jgi:hypothetical protein